MFSYQHEFHAGNAADVLKHIALVSLLDSLRKKDKPFTVIDSHAGAGRFHLDDERSLKTGEAAAGIKQLVANRNALPDKLPPALEHYLALQQPYLLRESYAGSPELERLLMRENDKLFLVEKHPAAVESLRTNSRLPLLTASAASPNDILESSASVSVTIREDDSYHALSALTPPLIKRGLVLTDPSYEETDDYRAVTDALSLVHRKWNTAIIALWYPLLTRKQNLLSQMLTALEDNAKLGVNPADCFKVELVTQNPSSLTQTDGAHLYGSGVFIMNPPWMMKEEMEDTVRLLSSVFS